MEQLVARTAALEQRALALAPLTDATYITLPPDTAAAVEESIEQTKQRCEALWDQLVQARARAPWAAVRLCRG